MAAAAIADGLFDATRGRVLPDSAIQGFLVTSGGAVAALFPILYGVPGD